MKEKTSKVTHHTLPHYLTMIYIINGNVYIIYTKIQNGRICRKKKLWKWNFLVKCMTVGVLNAYTVSLYSIALTNYSWLYSIYGQISKFKKAEIQVPRKKRGKTYRAIWIFLCFVQDPKFVKVNKSSPLCFPCISRDI